MMRTSCTRRYNRREQTRFSGHANAGNDLDDAGELQESVPVASEHLIDKGSQILIPVNKDVGKFVEAGENRRHGECEF